MSVKQSVNWLEQQRVDTPDLKAIDSSIIFDFKSLLQCFVGNNPYILQGFTIPVSGVLGPASSLQLVVDSSIVWVPGDINGSFLRTESGTPNEVLTTANSKVSGSFAPGANFVGVQFTRTTDPTTADLVSFWDVDSSTEFTKTVPRGLTLNYQIVISSTDFGNTAPIAIVNVSGSNVTSIENAKDGLFRLGRGGTNPDVNYSHTYNTNPENPLIATSNASPDPFAGGDWELETFKDWMDAVMSEIKAIKNSAFWYSPAGGAVVPGVNLTDLFFDAASSVVTGVGLFQHSATTPGLLTWTSPLLIRSIIGPLTYTVPAGNVTLADGQVAYISLVRNQNFQPANTFQFTNGNNIVVGTLNVSGIAAGDWIKATIDDVSKWVQVSSVSGSTISLVSNYLGTTTTGQAVRSQGSYTMQVASPANVPASANTYWFAKRDDNAVPVATIAAAASSGATRASNISTITTTSAHGLLVGEDVMIAGVDDPTFDGVYTIASVPTSTTFTYENEGSNVGSGAIGSGTVTVSAKIYLRALGELTQGESRQIDDVTIQNILRFIGAQSETSTTPPYTIVPNILSPYSYSTSNNLTQAISAICGNVNELFTELNQPDYDESWDIVSGSPSAGQLTGPFVSGSTFTIPVNSRLTGTPQQYYEVGKGSLEIFLNGVYLVFNKTNGWVEVGTVGTNSDQVIINQAIDVGDTLTFRIGGTGGPGSGKNSAPDDDFVTLPTQSVANNTDYVLIYDTPNLAYKKQTRAAFLAGLGNTKQVNIYTANHTASVTGDDVILVDASAGPVTITLSPVALSQGKVYDVKKIDSTSNPVTITGGGGSIDGSMTVAITAQYLSLSLVSDSMNYWII